MSSPVGAGSEGPGGSVPEPGAVDRLLISPVLVVCPHLALQAAVPPQTLHPAPALLQQYPTLAMVPSTDSYNDSFRSMLWMVPVCKSVTVSCLNVLD